MPRKPGTTAQITSRNHRIIQAYKAGGTAREIAPLYGLSPAMVRIVLIRCRAWNPAGPAAINQARFAERWNAGDGLCAMASHFGTGARRLVELAAHLGLPPRPSRAAAAANAKDAAKVQAAAKPAKQPRPVAQRQLPLPIDEAQFRLLWDTPHATKLAIASQLGITVYRVRAEAKQLQLPPRPFPTRPRQACRCQACRCQACRQAAPIIIMVHYPAPEGCAGRRQSCGRGVASGVGGSVESEPASARAGAAILEATARRSIAAGALAGASRLRQRMGAELAAGGAARPDSANGIFGHSTPRNGPNHRVEDCARAPHGPPARAGVSPWRARRVKPPPPSVRHGKRGKRGVLHTGKRKTGICAG